MDNAAYSYTKDGFDDAMEEMKKQSELAWAWMTKIPVETWARWAMDINCQTDLIVNNLSEVFNKYILDERNKPIVTMLVGIYDRCMMRWDAKREGAAKGTWEITSYYAEQLELMKTYSRNCIPKRADIDLWQVQSGKATEEGHQRLQAHPLLELLHLLHRPQNKLLQVLPKLEGVSCLISMLGQMQDLEEMLLTLLCKTMPSRQCCCYVICLDNVAVMLFV
jgi:hypothetical protein